MCCTEFQHSFPFHQCQRPVPAPSQHSSVRGAFAGTKLLWEPSQHSSSMPEPLPCVRRKVQEFPGCCQSPGDNLWSCPTLGGDPFRQSESLGHPNLLIFLWQGDPSWAHGFILVSHEGVRCREELAGVSVCPAKSCSSAASPMAPFVFFRP